MPRDLLSPRAAGAVPCVVVDNGSGVIKTGFAGEEEPHSLLPAQGLAGAGDGRPLSQGIVRDWDMMEAYWDYAFTHQLHVDTEQCNLLVTCNMFETKDNKERMMQSLFETFAAPAVFSSPPPVFELYASGKENGVVVGLGAQCTYAVLMHEGLHDPRTLLRSDVAGEALDRWTAQLLQQVSGGAVDLAHACKLKEALGVVSVEGASDGAEAAYELPDGRKLTLSAEQRAQITEPLFTPGLVGEACGGLPQLVGDCIKLRDRDGALESKTLGKDGTDAWFRNVILAGGGSCFPCLAERLQSELLVWAPRGASPEVHAPPERKHAAWLGGSILGSLSVMDQMWITKEEYDENGPLIVHRKCLF
ncbi:hypothetical protein AB1Y20_019675 [Prymnesium parvum]|uniref:Uncharacterized protein n=1 Tax=Prymnesium parvum TaxID=97485 RepID=A0AB34JT24_PRYPA